MAKSDNPFAIITGTSRGIGAEYARALARQGYDLLLISRDEKRMAQFSHELEASYGIQTHIGILDLATPGSAHELFSIAGNCYKTPDILINNAGFGVYGKFALQPMKQIQQMLHLHLQTVVESIRLFLPGMIERGGGAIINVSSIAGMFPIPYMAEYSATKAFLISFSEALAEEVRANGVQIQACCPGQTETSFHSLAGFKPKNPFPAQTTKDVVQMSLAALKKKQTFVTIGWQGKLSSVIAKWVPKKILLKAAGQIIKKGLNKSKF
jgi:short-subunit dehydrogenase